MAKFPFVVRIVSGQLLSGALSTHDFWSRYGQLVMVIKLNEGSVLGHQSKYENGTLIHAQRDPETDALTKLLSYLKNMYGNRNPLIEVQRF